jgi:hypothetical protein
MQKERRIASVIRKMSFVEAEEQEILQWGKVSFEEEWRLLESLRKTYYTFHHMPFPEKMERVLQFKNGWS